MGSVSCRDFDTLDRQLRRAATHKESLYLYMQEPLHEQIVSLRSYTADVIGLPDTEVLPDKHFVYALGSALSGSEVIVMPQLTTKQSVRQLREALAAEGGEQRLPAHLRAQSSYVRRCRELVGDGTGDTFPAADLAASIDTYRDDPASYRSEAGRQFERTAARAMMNYLTRDPLTLNTLMNSAPVTAVRNHEGERTLTSFTGLTASLPSNNGGLVEYGPGIKRGLRGVVERAGGLWRQVVMVHNDSFTSEVSRNFAERQRVAKRITVRSDGMAAASAQMREERQAQGAYGSGFDAVLASGLYQADTEEMEAAIGNTPDLLGPNGVLFIRDSDEEGAATPASATIGFARRAFGEPVATLDTELRGNPVKEAVFIKA